MKKLTSLILLFFMTNLSFVIAQKSIVYFIEEQGFPYAETEPLSFQEMKDIAKGLDMEWIKLDFKSLNALKDAENDLLIWPYGSAMADEAWPAVYKFLQNGGNLFVTGGRIFFNDIIKAEGKYINKGFTNRFAEQLRILDSEPLNAGSITAISTNDRHDFLKANVSPNSVQEAYSMIVMMSSFTLSPRGGSLSSNDGTWWNIVVGQNKEGYKNIPLISEINRLDNEFAGGKWLLFNFKPVEGYWKTTEGKNLLRKYLEYAVIKPLKAEATPDFAFYSPGEKPKVNLLIDWLQHSPENVRAEINILKNGKTIQKESKKLIKTDTSLLFEVQKPVSDGLYTIQLTLSRGNKVLYKNTNGFLVGDIQSLGGGGKFGVNSHFLTRGGQTFPVRGMTYMSSEVHRFYFIHPNPAVWDRDFKFMKESGINMIRTGIWTGHEQIIDAQGNINERSMRAWDAFFMIAKKYDIPVQLNFYHMQPSVEGIDDPYTNPKAHEAQKKYVLAFAERYKHNPDIIWDLINEPTFGKEGQVWRHAVPTGTKTEQKLWDKWLRERYNSISDLASKWNMTENNIVDDDGLIMLPDLEQILKKNLYDKKSKPLIAYDYNLFSQHAYNWWAKMLKEAIHSTGSNQLVVTGMDEGGVLDRVNHHFIAEESDFSNLHNWWQHDDLLWDNLMAKPQGKPLLIQESGNMRYTNIREKTRLSENELAKSLERKLAYGIGAEGGGYIPWIWNTNIYLFDENEAFIGLHRGDGTPKKEVEVAVNLNRFVQKAEPYFSEANDPEVFVIIPLSLQFSANKDNAFRATKSAIRTLHYYNRFPAITASEYHLDRAKRAPKLVILPSAEVIHNEAWDKLLHWVENGTTLLISGPIDRDPHYEKVNRLADFGVAVEPFPAIEHQSEISINGENHLLSFYERTPMANLDKMVWKEDHGKVKVINHGKGKILVTEYPVEQNTNLFSLAALYDFAAKESGVERTFSTSCKNTGVLIRPMDYQEGRFYLILSETDTPEEVEIQDHVLNKSYKVTLHPGRVKMLMISKKDGNVVAEY